MRLGEILSYRAGENLTIGLRVKLNGSGKVVKAGSDEYAIGTVLEPKSADQMVDVVQLHAGEVDVVANEAITVGEELYGAADGKVTPTDPGSGTVRFIATEAASADGQIITALAKF